jgi:hypothetical protein
MGPCGPVWGGAGEAFPLVARGRPLQLRRVAWRAVFFLALHSGAVQVSAAYERSEYESLTLHHQILARQIAQLPLNFVTGVRTVDAGGRA